MKNKFLILTIFLTSIIDSAYAFEIPLELKAGAIMFGKISVGVILSIIVIWFGLLIYKKILEKNNNIPSETTKKTSPKNKNKNNTNNEVKCEIDGATTIEEAINTFLTIDIQH